MKNYLMKKANRVLSKVVTVAIERELSEWPPKCALLAYQPMRPIDDGIEHTPNFKKKRTFFARKR